MIDACVRYFTHFRAKADTVPSRCSTAVIYTVPQILGEIVRYNTPAAIDQGKETIELLDHRVDEGDQLVTLLFGCTSKSASPPAIRDLVKESTRKVAMGPNDGVTYSAHVGFSLREARPPYYNILIEQVPRVSRTKITNFLNAVLRQDKDLARKDGTRSCYPKLAFEGEMSSRLNEALEDGGALHGIEFVRDQLEEEGGVGEDGMEPVRLTQSFRLRRKYDGALDAMGRVKAMFSRAQDGDFDLMRVKFTDPSTGKPQSVDIATSDDEAEDALYVRRSRHEFQAALASAPMVVEEHVHHQMRLTLRKESGAA